MNRSLNKIVSLIIFSIAFANPLSGSEPVTIKLTPPQISLDTISEEIICTRPMREGKFNISLEEHSNKTIVNCYGHGGSGWTTLFGSVNKAIGLFQAKNPSKETPIRIIGAGCMGQTMAIELKRLGYNVVGISAKSLYDTPSWRAAGYFALVSIKTSPEEEEDLNKIGLDTFLAYQKIDQGKHPYFSKDVVRFMPVYCSAETDAGLENLEERGMIPPRENVTLDFGNDVIHKDYVKFMTYFMNTTDLMLQLIAENTRLEIPFETKEFKSFDEISEAIVFNCCGLGGKELNADVEMIPVRGHLITLNEASGSAHMDYMIYTKVQQNGKDEYIYLFPKSLSVTPRNIPGKPCRGVLGGTFIPNVDQLSLEEQKKLDKSEFQRLLDRNAQFFQGNTIYQPLSEAS